MSSERILPQVRAELLGHRVRRFLDEEMACIQLDGPVRPGHVLGDGAVASKDVTASPYPHYPAPSHASAFGDGRSSSNLFDVCGVVKLV